MRSTTAGKSRMLWLWIVLGVVVIAALATTAFFVIKKPYVAVYLVTGDIYYGKMSCFPKFMLYDALFLQRGTDGNIGLQKLSDAFWKPKGPMVIERDQIVFWSKLSDESPIIDAIEGKALPQEMQAPAPAAQNQQGNTTDTESAQ